MQVDWCNHNDRGIRVGSGLPRVKAVPDDLGAILSRISSVGIFQDLGSSDSAGFAKTHDVC